MFTVSALVLPFFSLFIYCQAAYVDTLPHCSIKDTECIKGVYQHVMENVGSTGIEELGVPPFDPMELKDVSLTVLKAVTVTIKQGSAKGMSKCVFNKFDIDWEKERGFLNVTCDALSIKGEFVFTGENPELQHIIGSNNLNGGGKAKIKLDNMNINIEFAISLIKKDGDIYLKISNKNIKYTYDIGHAHFITEKVIIANNDFNYFGTMQEYKMFAASALVFTFSLFIYCDAAYVDTLTPCSINDDECFRGLYQHLIKKFGSIGIEEFGVSPLDPMNVEGISVSLTKGVPINITDGTVQGMSNCVFNRFNIDWKRERAFINVTCDALSAKGQFVISGENSELQGIIGSNNLNGQGRAKIKLENMNANIEFSIYVIKKDGEIYVKISNENIKYTYEIGHAHFITEKVIIANNDFSELLSSYLNADWRETMKQFGSIFIDKALELFVGLVSSVFDKIPASKYITEDLNSYVKH